MGYGKVIYIWATKREVKALPEEKKMGRPTDNPKGTPVHVRLDAECVKVLDQYCKRESVPRAEAIRRGILRLRDKPIKK